MNTEEVGNKTGREVTQSDVKIYPHQQQVAAWRQLQKGGSREDRTLREITVSLPPKISDYQPEMSSTVAGQGENALGDIARLDSVHGEYLTALSVLLLRAESVASSKIEYLEASMEDFAKATHGTKSNAAATSMVASANALEALISSVGNNGQITLEKILAAHKILMEDDPRDAPYGGRLRDMQNWIGGSDYSPRGAEYVPPPPETVEGYLADLIDFANRDDVPVLIQAAVTHAQFESIHPFTDGNGRIGRALINAIMRRRGITTQVVVPIASALVAKRDVYFQVLAAYRKGDVGPIIRAFAGAAQVSARESKVTAERLSELPNQWLKMYAEAEGKTPRTGSAVRNVLNQLPNVPFFTTEEMEELIGASASSTYSAIEKLKAVGILRPLTNRKRKQVWCAGSVIDELDDLSARIASETGKDQTWLDIQMRILNDQIQHNTEKVVQPDEDSFQENQLPESVVKALHQLTNRT